MGQFDGQRAGLRNDRALGSGIDTVLGRTRKAVNGSDITDRPTTVAQHVLGHALGEKKASPHVHVVEQVKLLRSHFGEGLVESDARVVDEAIDSSQKPDRLTCQTRDVPDIGEIRLERHGATPQGLDLLFCDMGTLVMMSVVQHDIGTLAGELHRDRATNTGAGSRDESALAGKLLMFWHGKIRRASLVKVAVFVQLVLLFFYFL